MISTSFSKLSSELTKKDLDIKVSRCSEVKGIQRQVENLVQHILDKVHEEDWRFKSKLLKVGSFYDGLKIGLPDEFDFLVALQNFVEHENFEVRPSGFWGTRHLWRTPAGKPALKKIQVLDKSFNKKEGDQLNYRWPWLRDVGTKSHKEYILHGVDVKNTFHSLVAQTVANLNEGSWSKFLISEEEPSFMLGPAVTLQLRWNGRKFKNLKLSVDLTVCIKAKSLPTDFDIFDRLNPESHAARYLPSILDETGYHLTPHVSGCGHIQWRVSTSYIESRMMQKVHPDSKLKVVIRYLKYIKDLYLKRLPAMDSMSDPGLRAFVQFAGFYAGKDMYEHKDLVPSYIIKIASLHAFGEFSQKEWNFASITTLFVYILFLIYLMIRENGARNFFIWKHKINVPDFGDVLPGFLKVFELIKLDDTTSGHKEDINDFMIDFKNEELSDMMVQKLFAHIKGDVNLHYNQCWRSES